MTIRQEVSEEVEFLTYEEFRIRKLTLLVFREFLEKILAIPSVFFENMYSASVIRCVDLDILYSIILTSA